MEKTEMGRMLATLKLHKDLSTKERHSLFLSYAVSCNTTEKDFLVRVLSPSMISKIFKNIIQPSGGK